MDLVKPPELTTRSTSQWPNMIIFPKELRDAIPDYGGRALVFDSVTGATHNLPAAIEELRGARGFSVGPRARVQLVVHETGKLKGRYPVWMDLDTATMRALGQFLVDLAGRAEAAQQRHQ